MSSAPPEDRCTWSRCERKAQMVIGALNHVKHPCCLRCAGSMIVAHWDDNPGFVGALAVPMEAR